MKTHSLLSLLVGVLVAHTGWAQSPEVYTAAADTFVQVDVATNHGGWDRVRVKYTGTVAHRRYSLMRFTRSGTGAVDNALSFLENCLGTHALGFLLGLAYPRRGNSITPCRTSSQHGRQITTGGATPTRRTISVRSAQNRHGLSASPQRDVMGTTLRARASVGGRSSDASETRRSGVPWAISTCMGALQGQEKTWRRARSFDP